MPGHAKMKYQRIELGEKIKEKWVICLVIMFTPRAMAINMSKIAHFLYFLLMTAKN